MILEKLFEKSGDFLSLRGKRAKKKKGIGSFFKLEDDKNILFIHSK